MMISQPQARKMKMKTKMKIKISVGPMGTAPGDKASISSSLQKIVAKTMDIMDAGLSDLTYTVARKPPMTRFVRRSKRKHERTDADAYNSKLKLART
jgi:hypothetical protein